MGMMIKMKSGKKRVILSQGKLNRRKRKVIKRNPRQKKNNQKTKNRMIKETMKK